MNDLSIWDTIPETNIDFAEKKYKEVDAFNLLFARVAINLTNVSNVKDDQLLLLNVAANNILNNIT